MIRTVLGACLLIGAAGFGYLTLAALRTASPPAALAVEAPQPAPPARAALLVAARALPAGTLVKDEDFAVRHINPAELPDGALEHSDEVRQELRGGMLRRYLDPGATVARTDVLRPRDRGFLAAVLRPGTRAIAVGVDAVTGAAGLIWPGDRVDVILTQELDAAATPLGRRVVGETVLTGVRVIAVDQHFTQGATLEPGPGTGGTQRGIARTVTLEATAEEAERVAVGGRLGRLSLTVRAMEDTAQASQGDAIPNSVFGGDVSPALSRAGSAVGSRMRVLQGNDTQEVVFR
ncbi:Flp pilus assembly protein CpaB [Falsiroseomonas tokyonensis]|uniref:Flp pilus assembly protein CpaB n=1 Tax=Falsiroseomonas tokyonensis TaxID=430521 RepID=A0ABV7BS74_9PROT|nr:Flp pilus assembly protein CpaB [Falsiroseomonas tokyonensis]MBU8537351.1 Flp pilus assembly protein CpaB [Falsiroseomonas tokyonensis]